MSTTDIKTSRAAARRWPLLLLAAPAAVSIWVGWVGLGTMSGFGVVHPLPGIVDSFTLNSAITLPIGVEAYSAYALGTWLSGRPMPATARRFAAWSSLIALMLGLVGQVIYHLLTTNGYQQAPAWVVVFVACLPVLVLGAGATLHHLLGEAPEEHAATVPAASTGQATEAAPAREPAPAPVAAASPPVQPAPARPAPAARRRKTRKAKPRRLVGDYLVDARAALAAAAPGTDPSPSWCRKVTGCSDGTSVKLAAALRAEQVPNTSMTSATPNNRQEAAA